jgi:hypothetical protein
MRKSPAREIFFLGFSDCTCTKVYKMRNLRPLLQCIRLFGEIDVKPGIAIFGIFQFSKDGAWHM